MGVDASLSDFTPTLTLPLAGGGKQTKPHAGVVMVSLSPYLSEMGVEIAALGGAILLAKASGVVWAHLHYCERCFARHFAIAIAIAIFGGSPKLPYWASHHGI